SDVVTVTAAVAPANATNSAVSWSSDNSNIVTVDASGTLTAVAAGAASITATTLDGGFTASTSVTVTGSSGGGGTACSNPQIVNLPFSFDGAGTYCWEISGTINHINSWSTTAVTINGVDVSNTWYNGYELPAPINGKYYVTYEATLSWSHFEASGAATSARTDAGSQVATEALRGDTLTEEVQQEIIVYPNPTNGQFKIEHHGFGDLLSVKIHSISGKKVFEKQFRGVNDAVSINASLEAGMYLLVVSDGQKISKEYVIIR
ncbi:MAG: Ig-like domain-containing protein, partial [Bacteroidota bacterium]